MGRSKILWGMVLLLASSACQDILEVPDISEDSVQLLAPAENANVAQNTVTFSWNEVYEATQYHLQVATPNFGSATQIVLDSIVVTDSTFLGARITKSLGDNNYEWRIKAQNSDYETEFSLSSFSVDTSGN